MAGLVATAETDIDASRDKVWNALTDPDRIKEYMMGSIVETDWTPGSPIVWKGEWEGKPYEDKGEIIEFEPQSRLVLTHYSPMNGAEDVPENYHTLTYELSDSGDGTHISLSQDNNGSEDEVEHSRSMWEGMLAGLKGVVEGG